MSDMTLWEQATLAYRVGSIAAIETQLREVEQAAFEMAAKLFEKREGSLTYVSLESERIRELAKERAKR